jgi:hypothetical protein
MSNTLEFGQNDNKLLNQNLYLQVRDVPDYFTNFSD